MPNRGMMVVSMLATMILLAMATSGAPVGGAGGLPSSLTTRVEIKGIIGTHLSEPSTGDAPYVFNPSYAEVSKGPRLLDAVCNEKLTVKLLDATQEAKEKTVCLGSASLSLVPLLQETQHIKQRVTLVVNPEAFAALNANEEDPPSISLDIDVAASQLLSFPEDFDDWNIFSVSVQGVYNLPSSLLVYGAGGPLDPDCHALTYNIHLLGCRLSGGNLTLPVRQSEEKITAGANTLKGRKGDKLQGEGKLVSSDRKPDTTKENDRSAAGSSGAGGDSRQATRPPVSTAECSSAAKHDNSPAGAETCEEDAGPVLAWEEQEVRFYRGRRFLAQLMHTIDRVGGVWLYLIPKPRAPVSDDKGVKGNSKHPKATPPPKNKAASKRGSAKVTGASTLTDCSPQAPENPVLPAAEPQITIDTCRHLAGRAWIPLDALRKEGCSEVSGSFILQPLEGDSKEEEEASLNAEKSGGRNPEQSPAETLAPPESFSDAQTHVMLSIRLKNPLLPVEPRDVPLLQKDVSTAEAAHSSPAADLTTTAAAAICSNSARSVDSTSSTQTAPAAYVPAHGTGCLSSLAGFRECVQQGIRWIAREVAESIVPGRQHLLAAAIASDGSCPAPDTRAARAAAPASSAVTCSSPVIRSRDSTPAAGTAVDDGESYICSVSKGAPGPAGGAGCSDVAAAPTSRPHGSCPAGRSRHLLRDPLNTSGAFSPAYELTNTDAAAGPTEALIKHLKQRGCYDALYRKVMKTVCTVIRDQLRQDVALTAAATAASAAAEAAGGCSGDEAQALQEGASSPLSSTGLLQQRLDRFFTEVFVQLVDTLQSTVNETTIGSQRTREHRRLQAPQKAVQRSSKEAEAAAWEEGPSASTAAATCRFSPQRQADEDRDATLTRLSFEAEVVGDMQRSIYLQKCKLATSRGRQDPALWCALARLLLRAGEAHVEQAESALWRCIDAQGGLEKASAESLLMLGSCLLHRKRFGHARAAFVRAVQRCTASSSLAPLDEGFKREEKKESQERHGQPQHEAAAEVPGADTLEGSCLDVDATAAFNGESGSFSAAPSAPAVVLPYFFLSISYLFAGDTQSFEKYLSLALKPAAYFQLDSLTHEEEVVLSATQDKTATEDADERPPGAGLQPPTAWPEATFEELEQTLSTFPRDTFYSPMKADYPALSLLLLLLKFGLPTLCFNVLALEDSLLHPETRSSRLLCLIKAKAYLLNGDFISAAAALHRLVATCPRHRETLSLLAECYFRQGLLDQATHYFKKSLEYFESSQDCVVYLRLGQLMLEKKDYEEACKYYKQSLQHSVTSEAWVGLAAALYRLRRLSEALEAATAANWLDRDRGETWGYLALIFLVSGSNSEAEQTEDPSSNGAVCVSTGSSTTSDTARGCVSNAKKSSFSIADGFASRSASGWGTPLGAEATLCGPPSCGVASKGVNYCNQADACTRYMLKNGVGARLGVGRLGGMTSVHAKVSLNPDSIFGQRNAADEDKAGADRETITTLDWGGGLLVEVAHQHLKVGGAHAAEIAEAVARRALENPLDGAAAARKVLAEALELQGRYDAAFEEMLQVMQLLIEEFEHQQRGRLRALVLMQQHPGGVTQQQKQHLLVQTRREHGQEPQEGLPGCRPEEWKQQVMRQKALTSAKLAQAQDEAWKLANRLDNDADRARLKEKEKHLFSTMEELSVENLLPGALSHRELDSDL